MELEKLNKGLEIRREISILKERIDSIVKVDQEICDKGYIVVDMDAWGDKLQIPYSEVSEFIVNHIDDIERKVKSLELEFDSL